MAGNFAGCGYRADAELQNAFKNTGTAHIIATFGLISVSSLEFSLFFSRFFGERRGAILLFCHRAVHVMLVQMPRLCGSHHGQSLLFLQTVGRRQFALNTLLAVAFMMTLWNPLFVWDVGFNFLFCHAWSYFVCRSIFKIRESGYHEIFSRIHGGAFS